MERKTKRATIWHKEVLQLHKKMVHDQASGVKGEASVIVVEAGGGETGVKLTELDQEHASAFYSNLIFFGTGPSGRVTTFQLVDGE